LSSASCGDRLRLSVKLAGNAAKNPQLTPRADIGTIDYIAQKGPLEMFKRVSSLDENWPSTSH
jgi:hypothetical protein